VTGRRRACYCGARWNHESVSPSLTDVLPPPSPEEWRRVEPLLDAVLDAPPERRAELIVELSDGDVARQRELERLVAECEREYPLLEQQAADRFASVFGAEAAPVPEVLAGRYQVVREVGRGGMAIVYLARDLKHGRDVAVKIVRPELAAALGRSRFLREIEIAAQLRHPHIVPLYDSGEVASGSTEPEGSETGSSVLYYVMPYETGRSLRERLSHDGPFSVPDAVVVLHDVCEALAHAHQHGIVHLDIKPENVLLSGKHALITDFGVARAVSEARADAALAKVGLAFGTPTYMAPEQAANDPHVDHRADIYAVGVLAYELLAGQLPFEMTKGQPLPPAQLTTASRSLTKLRADVSEGLETFIMKCLAKQPADRWQSADDLLSQLATITLTSASTPTRSRRQNAALIGATLGVVLILAAAVAVTRNRDARRALLLGRASQLTSEPGLEVQPSMSPDGKHVAYASGHSLQMRIAVRPVAGGKAIILTADTTANQWLPRWSPDGARILFLAKGGVFTAPAGGGPAREEVPGRDGVAVKSATWSADGREIAYVRGDSLLALDVASRGIRLIATGQDLHSCSWSPDSIRLACVSGNSFYVTVGTAFGVGPMFANLGPSRIVLIPVTGGSPVSVTDSGSLHQSPAWSRDGRTLYYVSNRQGPRDVYALHISARGLVNGDPERVTTGMGAHSISFSIDGARVAYAAYTSSANIWAMPIPSNPPASSASAVPLTSGNQTVEGVRVSADGRWLVYDSDLRGNSDVYRVPLTGGEAERLTRSPLDEFRGALSPNGMELVYHSFQTGSRNLFLTSLDGGPAQQITRSPGHRSMANWSPDGTALTMFDIGSAEVLVMRRDDRGRWGTPRIVGTGWRPEWSPDGRTIAIISPTDGRISIVPADSGKQHDLYLPRPGDPLAELAIFSESGRELYFKSHDVRGRASFWSIPVGGGRPRLLARFDDPARTSNRFEFASDGRRFYFTVEERQSDIWIAEVEAR
jgi:Tol biopolymer transport system component